MTSIIEIRSRAESMKCQRCQELNEGLVGHPRRRKSAAVIAACICPLSGKPKYH